MSEPEPRVPLRIALSATSAASLGAFEAGAVAALLTAVQGLNRRAAEEDRPPPVRIDAVGATSAGALVGVLACRTLLAGLDPVWVLREAWVERASLRRLTRHREDAPLSLRTVRADLASLLDPRDRRGRPRHRVAAPSRQAHPVRFSVALGCLQGLTYDLPEIHGDPAVAAMTHVDWADAVLRPSDELADYLNDSGHSPVDAVLASMSHPAAFPPRVLDRRDERSRYLGAGVVNFPDSGHLWYCDGSALLTRPFARTLAAARAADSEDADAEDERAATRMHLLVHPHTGSPLDADTWTDPDRSPPWLRTVSRVLALLTTEALYDDMRDIEKVNARVRWVDELAEILTRHLQPGAANDLADLLGRIRNERSDLRAASPAGDTEGAVPDRLDRLVTDVLGEAAGTAGRTLVRTEVISPIRLLAPDGADERAARREHESRSLLAGEFLGRFGGFTDRDLRDSDFVLGWRSCRVWLPDALRRGGLDAGDVALAAAEIDERRVDYGPGGPRGGASVRDLPLSARLRVARLVLSSARHALRSAGKRRHR